MKKTIISMTLAAVALFGGNAFAQTTGDNTSAKCSTEKCEKGDKKPCAFEGLNLTAQQQEQIKALQADQQKACKQACDKAKADKQKQAEGRREAGKTARQAYLAKVKAILTPEQYVQFLENSYVNAPAKMGNKKDGKKGDRKGGRDNKGFKGQMKNKVGGERSK